MSNETLMTSAENTHQAPASETAASPSATGADTAGQQTAPSTDTQTAQASPAEGAKPEGEQAAQPAGAPEAYDFKAIDGVSVDDAVIGAFSTVAKELNLPQDQAQKVLDTMAPVIAERQAEQLKAAREGWANGARTDKEFGGDQLAENLGIAQKALDQFGTPELKSLLNASGLGDHPEIIRAFYRAGKAISDDHFVGGKPGNATPPSVAQRMYPNMNP